MRLLKLLEFVALVAVVSLFPHVNGSAEQIGKSGKTTIHSAYKGVGNVSNVAENRMQWGGIYWGHSFNDTASGFLHNVAWNCPAAADIESGQVTFKGYCTLTDTDGDKIFGDWSGLGPLAGEITGILKMTGGNGKYSGIKGGLDFQCKVVGTDDQLSCKQQISYELP